MKVLTCCMSYPSGKFPEKLHPAFSRLLLAAVFALLAAGVVVAPRDARAARIFTSGFETNVLTSANPPDTEFNVGAGSATTQTATVHSGTYAAKIVTCSGDFDVVGSGSIFVLPLQRSTVSITGNGTTAWVRTYARFSALPSALTVLFKGSGNASAAGPAWEVRLKSTGVFSIRNTFSTGTTVTSTAALSANTWYRFEVRQLIQSTASTGELELRVFSGESTTAIETLTITGETTNNLAVAYFGCIDTADNNKFFFDDIAINDTTGTFQNSWPGPGKIALLKPDGGGSQGFLTAVGCTANWQCVDDVPNNGNPPDDSNTYVQELTAVGNFDRHTLSNLPAEVPSSANIILTDTYGRVGSDGTTGQAGMKFKLWDEGGTLFDGPVIDARVNGWKTVTLAEHQVFDAGTKTKANIDAFNGGYSAETGNNNPKRITAMWVDVEWIESPVFLRQEDYIFENDSASSVNENTSPVSAGAARANVEKGERFVTRFLLTNSGGTSTTTIFQVQYDHNDGNWLSVTSGEISIQYGISGTSVSQITSRKTAATCSGGASFNSNGFWYENVSTSTNYTTATSTCTELAWIFSTATATVGTTYRLRLFNQTANKVLDGSTATPTLTIVSTQTKKYSKTGTAQGERFSIPSNANDLTYWLDATGYSAVAADDSVYDTATAFQTNSVPISLYKIKNPNGNNTDQATITWNGQSNVAPSTNNVLLDVWNNSSNAWLTASTNNFSAANTDFTFSTATSGTALYDSSFFVYVRVRQAAGAEALRTDLISASFSAAGGLPIVTQRAFILQNDNGDTVDANTQRGTGIAYPVEKGERFTVRFQIDDVGGALTTQFNVQYDHNDGGWKSVSSGEISAQLGISGANGDALTSNRAGACVSGTSFVNGTWHEGTATTNSFTLTNGNCTEFAFIFSTATSLVRSTYNFRLVDGLGGNAPFASVATPSIVIITTQEKKYSKTGLGAELSAAPTNSNDLTYYLDATGYAAVISDDGVYDTATSTGAGNVPVSLFKIRNPWANTTVTTTITWEGQSSVAPSTNNVFIDIWNNTSGAWLNLVSNNSAGANTDFTLSTATSGAALFDANFFVYVRVRQAAGIEALRTDTMSIRFGFLSDGPQVGREDILNDSRPSATSNHTISFTINSGFDASEFLELKWPLDFVFPADLDCGDVDVATGT